MQIDTKMCILTKELLYYILLNRQKQSFQWAWLAVFVVIDDSIDGTDYVRPFLLWIIDNLNSPYYTRRDSMINVIQYLSFCEIWSQQCIFAHP